ncbi:MAG: hypothetical protein HYX55_03165 [Chloroflexi bacterium]|nr:hypothetical protein [Chloroflexota bacterium]
MRIPTWRLALTGGAIAILAVAGLGLAAASTAPATPAADNATAEGTTSPDATAGDRPGAAGLRDGLRGGRLLRAGKPLVHAEITVTDRDGKLVHVQLDHGTVQSIGNGSVTIAEAGGGVVTVSTDGNTNVFIGRKGGTIGDVKVGAEVFVRSRVDGGTTLAKRILVIPAKT